MRRTSLCIALAAGLLLSGCGGYARNDGSAGSFGNRSNVEVYGTIDVGVQHERAR